MTSTTADNKGVSKPAPPRDDEYNKYLTRVGYAKKDRWKWLLRLVNRYRKDHGESWVDGEWDIVCGELAAFTLGKTSAPGWGVIALTGGVFTEKPTHAEANAMLDSCLRKIEDAADHKLVEFPAVRVVSRLDWNEKTSHYNRSEVYDDRTTWLDRVLYPMAQMMRDDGDRLRRCPSQQPHGPNPCANLFLHAKRGKYCSSTCTSREMSRARYLREEDAKRVQARKGRKKR